MATITILIPTPLRAFVDGADKVIVEGVSLGDALATLGDRHEELLSRILTGTGEVQPFMNIFVGNTAIQSIDGTNTVMSEGDIVSIIPAIAGGLPTRAERRSLRRDRE